MTTTGLITYIQRKCPDFDRMTLLMLLNEIQKMVFVHPNELMRVYDETTGRNPVLTTVAGQTIYELDVPSFGWDIQFVEAFGYNYIVENGSSAHKARVIFKEDPGDGEIPLVCYRYPTELTSEHIQLDIPAEYHIDSVAKGVIGKCEESDHGTSNTWIEFKTALLPLMQWGVGKKINNKIMYMKGQGY